MSDKRPVIGITMGDPLGIGPEILVAALENPYIYEICRPVILGDINIMKGAANLKKSNIQFKKVNSPENGSYIHGCADILCLSSLSLDKLIQKSSILKKPDVETGKAMLNYITKAVDLALKKDISAIVTCPITKTGLKMAGSKFLGHTELIASRTKTDKYAMMLAGENLKVVLVTIHIPISEVAEKINKEKIVKTIKITANSLKERFGIKNPKIAVAGLNPHAGEDSLFGIQEEKIIIPAVKKAKQQGFNVFGPFPPDTVFFYGAKGKYDSVISMYHDQGLIPFKMIHFKDGVNTTLGLPIIRTSVDHGTAYDISWKGIADHTSLVQAIKMAVHQAKMMTL